MEYLYGPDASASPEHSERIPSFIKSSFQHVELLEGAWDFQTPASIYRAAPGVQLSMLPQPGNCAMGGCDDPEYSLYAHECDASKCGVELKEVIPRAPSQRAFS
jgi:hypothetical protein